MNRRGFLGAILAAGVAPVYVKYGSLMRPVSILSEATIVPFSLTETSLERAVIDLMNMTNERGLLLGLLPTRLIVHPDRVEEAKKIAGPLGVTTSEFFSKDMWSLTGGNFLTTPEFCKKYEM